MARHRAASAMNYDVTDASPDIAAFVAHFAARRWHSSDVIGLVSQTDVRDERKLPGWLMVPEEAAHCAGEGSDLTALSPSERLNREAPRVRFYD